MVDISRWTVQRDWENPSIYERNRCRMHVPLRSYTSKDAALSYFIDGPDDALQERKISLNSTSGDWKFKLHDKPGDVTAGFWEPEFDDSSWQKVNNISHTRLNTISCWVHPYGISCLDTKFSSHIPTKARVMRSKSLLNSNVMHVEDLSHPVTCSKAS